MPTCRHCGGLNAADARQCEKCGAALQPAAEPESAAATSTELSEHDAKLVELLRSGSKIEAIKLHRQATGLGLKESKDYVESLGVEQGISQTKGCGAAALMLIGVLGCSVFAIGSLLLAVLV